MSYLDDAISQLDALIAKLETASSADLKSPAKPGPPAFILLSVLPMSFTLDDRCQQAQNSHSMQQNAVQHPDLMC